MGIWRFRIPAPTFVLAIVLATSLALTALPGTGRAAGCKLALVLALDISSSVNNREYNIQLQGLARAFRTPEVIEAILTPPGAGIAAIVYEWSGYNQQDLVIPWTMLDSEAAIRDVAAILTTHRRPYTDLTTALGKAVEYGAMMFHRAPPCGRKVIDISGDGENNDGVGPEYFRAQGKLDDITINGLVVQGAYPDPAIYYREHVIQGPGAFVALARDFNDYPSVIIGKLLREIDQEMVLGEAR
jgi:Ca-activated chloride channel family protein